MSSDKAPHNDVTMLLSRLQEIASLVSRAARAGSLEAVLQQIAQVSRELVRARYAALGVPDGDGGLRYFKVSGLTSEEYDRIDHLPHGRGLLGAIMQERRTLRLERMNDDSRSSGFCANHPPMTSLLGVPVIAGDHLFGILYLSDREDGQPFSEADEWLIETMAGYAALAIAGSELSEQNSRLTLLEERDRIGMELHDGIIQSLYAIGMHLELLRSGGEIQPDALKPALYDLDSVIEDIRRYILNLKSSEVRTIREYMQEIVQRLHPPETLEITLNAPDEPPPFTPAVFEAVIQVAYEAISNAVRHSDARHVTIKAWVEGMDFHFLIADDGRGFDAEVLESTGLGLRNMEQRARLHGGNLYVESTPGQGTRITARIPVR